MNSYSGVKFQASLVCRKSCGRKFSSCESFMINSVRTLMMQFMHQLRTKFCAPGWTIYVHLIHKLSNPILIPGECECVKWSTIILITFLIITFLLSTVQWQLRGSPKTVQSQSRDSPETVPRQSKDSPKIFQGKSRDSTETVQRKSRNSSETVHRQYRDSIETVQK